MCGICGYVDFEPGRPADAGAVRAMCAAIAHRGPDGEACVQVGAAPVAVFGHRRLKVIDTSDDAAQPMPNEDASVWVTYNGEVYNFAALRAQLGSHAFASRSDTDVIVHGYEEWGEGVVDRLDGMFAFAVWDARARRLLLARDRAGKKPLYYAWDGSRLTFASELRAMRACPWVDASVDWATLPGYLADGYVAAPRTVHAGVLALPPASVLAVGEDGPARPRRYWSLEFGREAVPDARLPADAVGVVRQLFFEAVGRRLQADVPLGVLLSGGLDSALVVAAMSGHGVAVRTFTAGLAGHRSWDERPHARLVAERYATTHTEVEVRPDAAATVALLPRLLDQPFADSSIVPTYLIARAAREHVTVVLTGDGGDDVFAGYERFAAAGAAARVPATAARAVSSAARLLPARGYFDPRSRVRRFTAAPGAEPLERYATWVRVCDDEAVRALTGYAPPRAGPERRDAATEGGASLLDRAQTLNFHTYLPDDLLAKQDRATMAASLEARSPMLDTALVEAVASRPQAREARLWSTKRLLRRAARGLVPDEIVRARKHGFGVPVGEWFRGELREPFADLVLAPDARLRDGVHLDAARGMFDAHCAGRAEAGPQLWALFALEAWLRSL